MRWGFLGAGFVATNGMAPAVHAAHDAVLQRVAARDVVRARAIEPLHATTSYQDVIDADDVDAIYISLTNDTHESWVTEALRSGKHVLCEKPLSVSAASVRRMAEARSGNAVLVEALWYRWHPRYRRTMDLIASGAIGEITAIDARFCFSGVPIDNYRLDPARGGGATLDVGPYAVDTAISVVAASTGADQPPLSVTGRRRVMADPAANGGVDTTISAELVIDQVSASIQLSIDSPSEQRFHIEGTAGTIDWPGDEVFTVWRQVCELVVEANGTRIVEEFVAIDPYVLMIEQAQRTMAGSDPPVMPLAHSIRLAEALDVLRAD